MKTKFWIIWILPAFLLVGCEKVLDVQDLNSLNSGYVWNDEKLADAYLVDLYASLPAWPKQLDYVYADEMLGVFTEGMVTEENDNYFYWPYNEIRKINILLNEIDEGTLSDKVKEKLKAQASFLRAWHYFKMVVYHGGVPIIKKPQSLDDNLYVPRNTTKETFEFILSDLDYAIAHLPDKSTGENYGRIDKAAAMAFKGRVALYMASPQYHPDNPYGNEYWQQAYSVNKEAKDFLKVHGYALYSDYKNIWADEGNSEVILPVVFTESYFSAATKNMLRGRREDLVRPYSVGLRGTRIELPIWNFVEVFPMKDGYAPGTSPDYSYDLQTFWENRDPRFYDLIAYNGSIYPAGVDPNRRQYTDLDVAKQSDGYLTCAGFYNKKGLNLDLPKSQTQKNDYDWVEIRFAEVLLNFAEAACETGHENEAVEVLKQIRQRAGIEAGNNGMYGLKESMTREELRDAVMFERRIEFAFEGKRFWDLRRTRRFAEIDGLEKMGCKPVIKDPNRIDEGATWQLLPEDFSYSVEIYNRLDHKMFVPEKYYFFPLMRTELEKNSKLEQNNGWSGGTFDPTIH